jgi:hypothetical protein
MLIIDGMTARASPATPNKRKTASDDSTPSKKKATPKKKMLVNDQSSSGEDVPYDTDAWSK